MADKTGSGRRINWLNTMTVVSAMILIGVEVFGAAFAGSWALANLFGFDNVVARGLDITFLLIGAYVMYRFVKSAQRVEPFTS